MSNLLKSKLSIDEKNCSSSSNGANNGGKMPDLIDLAPLSYSKADLLEILDENWFQRTATVNFFLGYFAITIKKIILITELWFLKVVGIIEKKNSRCAAGHLKLFPDKSKEWVLFSPNDSRLPRMKIKLSQCPPGKHIAI